MILEAQPEDIDEVYTLWCELMDYHRSHHPVFQYNPASATILKAELVSRLKDKDSRFFIYQREQEWVGMLVANFRRTSEAYALKARGYIAETIIREQHRNSGAGKALFDAACKWLLDKGADHIELQVSVKNKNGIKFWESRGFRPSTQHMILDLRPLTGKD